MAKSVRLIIGVQIIGKPREVGSLVDTLLNEFAGGLADLEMLEPKALEPLAGRKDE